MTRHGRPGLSFAHLLIPLSLALIPTIVLAAVPVLGPNPTTEVVSGRTFRVTDKNGQAQAVPDLAVSGQVLARVSPTTTPQQMAQLLQATGCQLLHQYRTPGLVLLGLPANTTVSQGINLLRGQMIVRSASADRLAYPTRTPNDPSYSQQYHWPLIDAPAAWDSQTGSSNILIGVIDDGLDTTHEDLAGRVWRNTGEIAGNGIDDDNNGYIDDVNGWDFINGNNDVRPGDGTVGSSFTHGTHVSGIIGAISDNGVGVAGHMWDCQIMMCQVFNNGSGDFAQIIAAYEYAAANGAQVINMSLGGGYIEEFNDPITLAYNQGIVTVAAAGNESFGDLFRYFLTDDPNTWLSPVCNDGPSFIDNHVIGVGATDSADVVTSFSVLDKSSRDFVDVMAPGNNIYSTYYFNPAEGFNSRYGLMSGTSMACPVVAGLAGLVLSEFPNMTPAAVTTQITAGSENIDLQNPINIGFMGAGRVNTVNCLGDQPCGPPRSVMAFDTPNDTGGSITVTWGTSLDDGRGFNDVIKYEVRRSTAAEGPFDLLGDVPKGSKGYVDATVTDYVDYYYQVYSVDAANKTASPVTGPAAARDDIAPDPVTAEAKDTIADLGGSISLTWGSYSPPQDFKAYHVYRSEESFTDVSQAQTAALAEPVILLATITDRNQKSYQDRTTEDDTDYFYAVTALDTAQPANEETEVEAVGPVRSNPNYAFGFPPGLALIGVGLTLQDNELDDVFNVAGGLQFARWDPSAGTDGAYVTYSAGSPDPFLRLMPGRGFWMRSGGPVALSLSGSAATQDVRADFAVGWNQMGNPYIGDVDVSAEGTGVRIGGTFYDLAQSNARDYTRDFFWTYDSFSSSYKLISASLPFSTPTIRKGEGFFFLSNRTGQLVLKNPSAVVVASAEPARPQAAADGWSLRLAASIDGAADTDNFLGVSSRAAQISNIVSPPPATDGPDLVFTSAGPRAATDFVESLGQAHTWTAEVSCARPGAAIKLSWPDLSSLPREAKPILTDTVTGRSVYMRTGTGYGFTLGSRESSRKFTIEISTKAGDSLDSLAIQSLQTDATRGNVRISYVLSTPAAVDVEIRNVAGRLVRRLGSASLSPAGSSEAIWNCTTENGQRVPAGSYLVCVTGRADSGQVVKAVQSILVRR